VTTVIVTGGSRGLGAGLVDAFLEDGANVATCSRTPSDNIERWRAAPDTGPRFHYTALDMTDREACEVFVRDVVERFGEIDVLINNAGLAIDGVLGTFQEDDTDTVIDLNLRATIRVTKLVVRRMLRRGSGRIINISSVVGLRGYRGLAVYGATKAALDGFTRALARELGTRAITVNSVAPGYLRTEMTHGLTPENLEQIARRTPAGRLGEVSDVVAAVRFLVSPDAGFITGHTLVVDGGLTS
jgi:3-oxoacyl-[acyl-carrier protein] reductase